MVGVFMPQSARSENAWDRASFLGGGLGALVGLASNPKKKIVEVPADSLYVLTLEAPIVIAENPQALEPVPQTSLEFQFQTVQEYSAGLAKLLQVYQQGEATAAQVLDRVRAADAYATTQLQPPLSPPVEQRQLMQQLVGFEYAIDRAS